MKQRIFLLALLFLLILTRTNDISAKETKLNEDMFTNVENTLKDKEIDLSYTQLVKQLIHGNVKGVLHTIKAKMKEVFLNRMLIQKDLIREILLIAFTAAIFKNLSDSFFQQSTANSAFYITYVIPEVETTASEYAMIIPFIKSAIKVMSCVTVLFK